MTHLKDKITFDIVKIRSDFPLLKRKVNGKPLVYLDNGASSQKPTCVLDCIANYYTTQNANIHRGVHALSQEATSAYEDARKKVQLFIGAKHSHEVIFTSGTTDSINLVANSFGELLKSGDEILITEMEHHSNIVPWQMLCERKGCSLSVVKVNAKGELDLVDFSDKLSSKTKLVAISHISNSLGTVNPIKKITQQAHEVGAKVLVDGAQAIHHIPIDVEKLDCDFYAFSSHKMYGPTGVGVLYGKESILDTMPPYQGGGEMIAKVTFDKTTYNELPHKFEAGTPNIAGGIATGAAIDYLNSIDFEQMHAYELELLRFAEEEIQKIDGVQIIGTAKQKVSVLSFIVDGIHPFDVGTLLDKQGIAVRTGHHCTQPLMDVFQITGTIRASFALYNTKEEIIIFVNALKRSLNMLQQ